VFAVIGVIVSHTIVPFEFIDERREEGEELELALIDAGILRFAAGHDHGRGHGERAVGPAVSAAALWSFLKIPPATAAVRLRKSLQLEFV
jgi:hypothetical protein